jgi:hypothetical protein
MAPKAGASQQLLLFLFSYWLSVTGRDHEITKGRILQRGPELKLVLGGYIQANFEDGDVSAFEGRLIHIVFSLSVVFRSIGSPISFPAFP